MGTSGNGNGQRGGRREIRGGGRPPLAADGARADAIRARILRGEYNSRDSLDKLARRLLAQGAI